MISKEQMAKVRMPFRVLAGIIFALCILTIPLIAFAVFREPLELGLFGIITVTLLMGYVTGKVAFTGYAPKLLLFAHGEKTDE